MATYAVQEGDTLPTIARLLLGGAGHWRQLQVYNLKLLLNPASLAPGMVLRLPPGAAVPARSAASSKQRSANALEAGGRLRAVARAPRRRHG